MKPTTGITFVLKNQKGKILMQLRDGNTKNYPNCWCFPGGAKEPNEDFLEALKREVFEEYGIRLNNDNCTFLTDFDEGAQINKVYICKILNNQIPILGEGVAMKWMSLSEIEKTRLGFNQEGLVPLLKKASD